MDSLSQYNGMIIDLYEKNRDIKYISNELFNKANRVVKSINRLSGRYLVYT